MTLTATYQVSDAAYAYGGVHLTMSSAPAGTDFAVVQRSTDGITWTTVRGGDRLPVASGAAVLDDYEFVVGVSNQYRAQFIDVDLLPTYIATGTVQSGNNTSLVPPHPAGLAVGDLKLIHASIRNSGTGTVNTPAGWTQLVVNGNMAVLGKIHVGGDTAPTVTFAGGAAGEDTLAVMANFRNAQMTPDRLSHLLNGVAQDITSPSMILPSAGMLLLMGWKQDDWTGVAPPTFATEIADFSATAGNDAGQCWYYFSSPPGNIGITFTPTNMVVTGGATAISRSSLASFPVVTYTQTDTASITPATTFDEVWIKNPQKPGNNVKVLPTDMSEITRRARTGLIDVLGRTMPVAVTDVASSRSFTIEVDVGDNVVARDMDNRLASGDPMYLQGPATDDDVPTLYFVCGDVTRLRDAKGSPSSTFRIPITEVAKPGSTVAGITYQWSDVYGTYVDWAATIAANATWADLINKISNTITIVN